jgi:hypothetical protein
MFIEGFRHLLHGGTQRLAGARGRLTLWVRHPEADPASLWQSVF